MIWNAILLVMFLIVMGVGMGLGGFYLLDYLIKGETVETPRVIGMSKARAIETLTEAELMVSLPIEEVIDEETPPGIVIEQKPFPGSKVKKGRRISLKVSKGPRMAMIPNLVGRNDSETQFDLRSVDLSVDLRATVYHSSMPAGVVLAQNPPPGARLVLEKSVDKLVSLGPQPVGYVMPRFVGADFETLKSSEMYRPFQSEESGVTYQSSADPTEWGRVISQQPQPGARVSAGELVMLTVGSSSDSLGRMHIAPIEFDDPPVVFQPRRLVLMIWDDKSRALNQARIHPLNVPPGYGKASDRVLLFGDALVVLAIEDTSRPERPLRIVAQRFVRSPYQVSPR